VRAGEADAQRKIDDGAIVAIELKVKEGKFKSVEVFNEHIDRLGEVTRQAIIVHGEKEMLARWQRLRRESPVLAALPEPDWAGLNEAFIAAVQTGVDAILAAVAGELRRSHERQIPDEKQ
jgi:hypothetical protein